MHEVRDAIVRSGVLTKGHFIFADGGHATTKLEMDCLWDHEDHLETIVRFLAQADGLPPADIILGVPVGGQRLASELRMRGLVSVPLARLERVPGGAKQDFRFLTETDRQLAQSAKSIRIYEDVVTTGSSVAGVVRLLDSSWQEIHALSIWRRGEIKERYAQGVTHHFLVEEPVPNYSPEQCPVCLL
jgi:orotate phosphoribosyltransferase